MGLLDQMTYDPQMALGMGLLNAGGNSRMPVSLGQGLAQGFGNMQETAQMGQRAKLMEQEAQMRQAQMQQYQAKTDEMKRRQAALTAFRDQLPPPLQSQFDVDPQGFITQLTKQQEEYTLTPGAARFKGNQKLAEVPMKPNEAPLPWYVKPTPDGKMAIDPAYADLEKTKASFARPPSQPMAPVAYVDDKGQTVWGTINEARGRPAANFNPAVAGQVAQAKGHGTEKGKGQAEAESNLPKAIANGEMALSQIKALREHPGFGIAVGKSSMLGTQKVPGTDGFDFINRLEQLKGGAFLTAFETLKGGGQITEVEGKKATAAIARMDNATSEKEFNAALSDYESVIKTATANAKMRAGKGKSTTPTAGNDDPLGLR